MKTSSTTRWLLGGLLLLGVAVRAIHPRLPSWWVTVMGVLLLILLADAWWQRRQRAAQSLLLLATPRLFWLLGAAAILGLAAGLFTPLLPLWWALVGPLGLAVLADAWWLGRCALPDIQREMPESLAVDVWTEVCLKFRCDQDQAIRLEVFDKPPACCEIEGMPAVLHVQPDMRTEVRYRIKAHTRGAHTFDAPDLRIAGPLGLLRRHVTHGPSQPFRVLPNFKAVSRYALFATANRVGQLGIRKLRRRGSGLEFSHLRDYRDDDLTRQIDWKASARRNKLISREYEDERNQHLVFMLDCGRRMRARDGKLSHFDHCLNATLLLTHVAIKQGDSVALSTFGGQQLWVPRQRGAAGMNAVLQKVYDLQTTLAPSDYSQAARRLATLQPRRSLVVLLTNLYDQDNSELLEAIALLRRRHVVLVASLREAAVDAGIQRPIVDLDDALSVAAGHQFLAQRQRTHQELHARNVLLLDVQPDDLSVELVNRYLQIKSAGLL